MGDERQGILLGGRHDPGVRDRERSTQRLRCGPNLPMDPRCRLVGRDDGESTDMEFKLPDAAATSFLQRGAEVEFGHCLERQEKRMA